MKSENEARFDTLIISTSQYENTRIVMDVTADGTEDLIVFSQDSLYFIESDEDMQFIVYAQSGVFHPALIRQHPDLPPGTFLAMTLAGLPLVLQVSYQNNSGLHVEQDYNAFSPFVQTESTYASSMTRLDVDADGLPENCINAEFTVAGVEVQPDSTLREHIVYTAFNNFSGSTISAGDWNGDGHDDLFLSDHAQIYVATRQSDSILSDRVLLTDGLLFDAHDFDQNGFSDLLISIYDSTFILYNQDGVIIRQEILATGMLFPSFTVFDPYADGYLDVALSRDTTFVFMNDGTGNISLTSIKIPGNLAHSTLPNSPYLFTVLFQNIDGVSLYRPSLHRISDDGQEADWIAGYVWVDSVINSREAWLINFDSDSMPDMLFNVGALNEIAWKALLINDQGAIYDISTVPDAFVLGVVDATSRTASDIVYAKGAKAYLLHGRPPGTSSTSNPKPNPIDLIVVPNPLPLGSPWNVRYSNDYYGPVWIELYLQDGRFWRRYLQFKTNQLFECSLEPIHGTTKTMLVRIVDGKGAATKKMILICE